MVDAWWALQRATDKKRVDVLADIVSHPEGLSGVKELAYMTPSLSDDAIRWRLKELMAVGLVQEHAFDRGAPPRLPYKFYELTDAARALFNRNGLFPEEA